MKAKTKKGVIFFTSENIIYLLYISLLIITTLYSYSLVDLNLTLFNNHLWAEFRKQIIQIGYFHRNISAAIYLATIITLFVFNFLIPKRQINPMRLAFISSLITLFSYPFLSHDFFNYLFDAKILTFYHQNPYLHKPLDFPDDPWLRFMHWVHRKYPYGVVFLIISLIPSFLAMGKFILNFFFFKLMFVSFYLIAVYYLQKLDNKWALIFTTHPLVIIEGLVSSHNDLIAVSLATLGIYYLFIQKNIPGRLFLLFSAGIKYTTLPLIILTRKKKQWNLLSFFGLVLVLIYLSLKLEIQPWYFLSLFVFLPFYQQLISKLNIFFAGLLFSYYPYIRFGGWDNRWKIMIKHQIIIFFLITNVVVLLIQLAYKLRLNKKK